MMALMMGRRALAGRLAKGVGAVPRRVQTRALLTTADGGEGKGAKPSWSQRGAEVALRIPIDAINELLAEGATQTREPIGGFVDDDEDLEQPHRGAGESERMFDKNS